MIRGLVVSLLIGVSCTASAAAAQRPAPTAPPARKVPATAERDRMLDEASAALQAGRTADARRLLQEAADELQSVRALLQLARLQSTEGDAAGALATLARARALAPNAEEVLSLTAQIALAARAPVPAIRALEPLARVYPTVAQHHYLLGVARMQVGDMLAAIEALREAERLEPARPLTLVALGIAYNDRKMFGEARDALLRAAEREPESVEALAALAEAEEGLDDLDAAEAHAARALAAAPGNATANLVTGMIHMKREQYADARASFERAAAASPDSPRVYYQLSLACARLGDAAASAKNLELYREKLRAMEARLEEARKFE